MIIECLSLFLIAHCVCPLFLFLSSHSSEGGGGGDPHRPGPSTLPGGGQAGATGRGPAESNRQRWNRWNVETH